MRTFEHHRLPWRVLAASAAVLLASCSLNRVAVRGVADFLASSGESTVFSGDDDPELVGQALPFALKIYESLLASDPDNAPLALATGRSFVSYAFAFVQAPADLLPVEQADRQRAERLRAKKLFLRGRDDILNGLETRRPGFRELLDAGRVKSALERTRRDDIDYLYWAGTASLAAFGADPFDFDAIVTVPRAVALLQQVLAWDPGYGAGSVDEILISFYGSAPENLGGGEGRARESFDRAVALSRGLRVGPYTALAASVSVKDQNVAEYRDLLHRALAIDVNADVPDRLVNIIGQRKARWMLEHEGDFFLDTGGGQ
ncbi:MAG TPA: TRAP transporter TatT component family protein [Spirochaetia bacterium]